MNKKIEDAAMEYLYIATKNMYKSPSLDHDIKEAFKSGAECALREAIKILEEQNEDAQYLLKRNYASDYSQGIYDQTVILKKLIEQLLSTKGEKNGHTK